MALVRQHVQPLVMADECVNMPAEAMRVIESGAADVISLKFPKMGGLFMARKVASVCEAADIQYLVGTAPGNKLAGAANIHLAVRLKNLTLRCELGEFERYLNDPCSGLEVKNGYLKAPEKPGLGVEIDLAAIGLTD